MNIEQIMIRLGVDGTAIKSGLARVSSLFKAWGKELHEGFKEYTGSIAKGFIGAEAFSKAFEFFGELKNKILEISRVSKETGASTDFVQGLMEEAEKSGVEFEKLSMGIAKFNATLGSAKAGNITALKTLSDIGVINDKNSIKTVTFSSAIHSLAVRYEELTDKQRKAYLLQQAFGRGYAGFTPIFEKGPEGVDELGKGGFFKKISAGTIDDFTTAWRAIKTSSTAVMATIVNTLDIPFQAVAKVSYGLGLWSKGIKDGSDQYREAMRHRLDEEENVSKQKAIEAMADKEGISVAEFKTKLLEQQASLLEKQLDLTSTIADRNKESVNEMASAARKATGLHGPLEMFEKSHTVTPRMRTALQIKNLEDRAQVAWLKGDDTGSNRLQSEADQVRKSNTWMKRSDVNPMQKTESELARVNDQLEPVKRMAELVNNTKSE